jgi:8-oxo-dGTP pyrophosphatase MutT (NUDIX family)
VPLSNLATDIQVFPGGNHDASQDDSLAMTAVRETFEESGLLLAQTEDTCFPDDRVLDDSRRAVCSQRMSFTSFLAAHHLRADVDSLLPFTQWVTPVGASR